MLPLHGQITAAVKNHRAEKTFHKTPKSYVFENSQSLVCRIHKQELIKILILAFFFQKMKLIKSLRQTKTNKEKRYYTFLSKRNFYP